MGFSIGSLLKTVAGPIIGSIIGGPAGAILGAGITSAFGSSQRPGQLSFPGPTVIAQMPAPGPAALAQARLTGRGGVPTVADLLRLSRETTGRPASSRKIRESARVCGLEVTAQTFGLTVTQICQIVIARGPRRGRGISAADMRRTRSTIRKISTLQHNLAHLVSHTRGRARGAGGKFI